MAVKRPVLKTTTTVVEETIAGDGAGENSTVPEETPNENPKPTSETQPADPVAKEPPTEKPLEKPPEKPLTPPTPEAPTPKTSSLEKLTEDAIRAALVTNNTELHPDVKALLKDAPVETLGDRLKDPILLKLNETLNAASTVTATQPRNPVVGKGGVAVPAPTTAAETSDPKPKRFGELTMADYANLASVFR